MDINNLGEYASLNAVWKTHPDGGREGDYLTVGGVKHRWNKYDQIWENAQTVTQSLARRTQSYDGDVWVGNDLYVGGKLTAHDMLSLNQGLFDSEVSLNRLIPSPKAGMWALVGVQFPADVYVCEADGAWTNSGGKANVDVDLTEAIDKVKAFSDDMDDAVDGLRRSDDVMRQDIADVRESVTNAKETMDGMSADIAELSRKQEKSAELLTKKIGDEVAARERSEEKTNTDIGVLNDAISTEKLARVAENSRLNVIVEENKNDLSSSIGLVEEKTEKNTNDIEELAVQLTKSERNFTKLIDDETEQRKNLEASFKEFKEVEFKEYKESEDATIADLIENVIPQMGAVSQEEYDALVASGDISDDFFYFIEEEQ